MQHGYTDLRIYFKFFSTSAKILLTLPGFRTLSPAVLSSGRSTAPDGLAAVAVLQEPGYHGYRGLSVATATETRSNETHIKMVFCVQYPLILRSHILLLLDYL